MESSTTLKEPANELIQRLLESHEKKKAYDRAYMSKKRLEHKDELNKYNREIYYRQKAANPQPPKKRGRKPKVLSDECHPESS